MGKCTGEALKMMTGGPDAVPEEKKERKMSKWLVVMPTGQAELVEADGYWVNYDDNLEFYTEQTTTTKGWIVTKHVTSRTTVALFRKVCWSYVTEEKDAHI